MIMGRDSEFNRQKDRSYRIKLEELKKSLPTYTYEFLDSRVQRNPNTAVSYAYDLITFLGYLKEFCPPAKDYDLNEIPADILDNLSFQDINEYQKYLSAKDVTVIGDKDLQNDISGIARKMSALRSFYKYQCQHDFLTKDPTVGANKQSRKDDDHVIIRLTPSEVDTFLTTIKNCDVGSDRQQKILQNTRYRDYAILTLLLRTGIRVSECVGLDLSDINFKEMSMCVVRKGHKEHILYFDDVVEEALMDYIQFERPKYIESDKEKALFLSNRKKRLAVRSIQEMVDKYAKVAVSNKKISPHKMRSTYGTALYNKTGDIRLVADVLGHSDINTTAKHYAASEDAHRRMAAKIDPYSAD
ncbi:MAG: tyrosine-type recombinase/integrase [Lachnospiraceae bacterium]|nr:tyrosine-type recombinase/integrase [Lachnospiraceae bacterium]